MSVSIKNFVLDDSERLICISLSTRQFFLLFKIVEKTTIRGRIIFGFNYLQKDTIFSIFFKKILVLVNSEVISLVRYQTTKSNKQFIATDN